MTTPPSSAGTLIERYAGSLLALLATAMFVFMDALAQSCTKHGVPPGQAAFTRMALTLPLLSAYILNQCPSKLQELDPRGRSDRSRAARGEQELGLYRSDPALAARFIWLRALLTSGNLCLIYASMARIPLADFVSISATKAFIVGFFCWAVLREAFGWKLLVAATACTAAVVLIVQPPILFGSISAEGFEERLVGYLLLAGALVLDGAEMLVLRVIGPGPNPFSMTLAYCITCVMIAPIYMIFAGETFVWITDMLVLTKLVALALIGFAAQICLVIVLQKERDGRVAVISYAGIPISLVVQSFAVGDVPSLVQIAGMMIILGFGIWSIADDGQVDDAENPEHNAGYAMLLMEDRAEQDKYNNTMFSHAPCVSRQHWFQR